MAKKTPPKMPANKKQSQNLYELLSDYERITSAAALIDRLKWEINRSSVEKKINPGFYDTYYSISLINKKSSAVVRKAKEAKRLFGQKYPDIDIIDSFSRLNGIICFDSYNIHAFNNNHILAVALWILDALKKADALEQAFQYFPLKDEIKLPECITVYRDYSFDEDTIKALCYLIAYRNNEPKDEFIFFDPNNTSKTKIDWTCPQQTDNLSCRERLNGILSFIPQKAIDEALKSFNDDFVRFHDLIFSGVNQYISKAKQANDAFTYSANHFSSADRIVSSLKKDACNVNNLIDKGYYFVEFLNKTNIVDVVNCRYPDIKKINNKVVDFEVTDPYAISFAVFYFMEKDDPTFWCNMTVKLFRSAGIQLPWGFDDIDDHINLFCVSDQEVNERFELLNKEFPQFAEMYSDLENAISNMPDDNSEDEFEKWSAISALKYEAKTTDCESSELQESAKKEFYSISGIYHNPESKNTDRLNGAHFLFSRSNVIPPRDFRYYVGKTDAAKKYNEHDNSQFFGYSLGVLHASADCQRISAYQDNSESVENMIEEIEKQENKEEYDIDKLLEEIALLKKQAKKMKSELYDANKKYEDVNKEIEQIKEEKESVTSELAELRSMICPIDEKEKTVEFKINFPYEPMLRHVVFGGHASWLKSIRYMLPNVRFIDPNMKPDLQLVDNADVVWIQSNAISHAYFNMVLDRCRLHDIDYQYLDYASAEKCAEQVALYDIKKVEGQFNA